MNSLSPLVAVAGGLRLGGSTTFLLNLGKAFCDRGLVLPIVCLSDQNEMAGDFTQAGIQVEIIADKRMIFEDRLQHAYATVAAHRPNGVLACLGEDSFEVLRMLPHGIARVGMIQSDDPGPYKVVREFAPWLDAIVGVSETICNKLKKESLGRDIRIEHIPYGIHFAPARNRPAKDTSQPLRIIYVGRMIEIQKRVSRLVELVKLLAERGERFEFTFVGSGPELESSRNSLKDVPQARFLGDVPNREISGLLQKMDVFVLLSDFEGLPLSLLEAMGEGLVPVVSDLESGMREVVTADTGIRVPVGNIVAAADAISVMARDHARLPMISKASSEFVRWKFNATLMGERYVQLTNQLSKKEVAWPEKVHVPVPLSYGNNPARRFWGERSLRRIVKRAIVRAS